MDIFTFIILPHDFYHRVYPLANLYPLALTVKNLAPTVCHPFTCLISEPFKVISELLSYAQIRYFKTRVQCWCIVTFPLVLQSPPF